MTLETKMLNTLLLQTVTTDKLTVQRRTREDNCVHHTSHVQPLSSFLCLPSQLEGNKTKIMNIP